MAESTNYPEVPPERDDAWKQAEIANDIAAFGAAFARDDDDDEACADEAAEPRVFEETLTFSVRRFIGGA